MKKLIFATALSLFCFQSNIFAQKNIWLVDFEGGYSSTTFSDYQQGSVSSGNLSLKNRSFYVRAGKAVSKNSMLGIQGGAGLQNDILPYTYNNGNYALLQLKRKTWSAGIFYRYTYWVNKWIYAYLHCSLEKYGSDNTISEINNPYNLPYTATDVPEEGHGTYFSVVPGAGINLIRGFGGHIDIGSIDFNNFDGLYYKSHNLNCTLGQSFTIGIHKIFGWKKMEDPNKKPAAKTEK